MAELLFKRGLHANLPATAVDGAFYLTEDSHRLYVGIGTQLVDLNKYTHIVDAYSSLSTVNAQHGDFAYLINENILAVYLRSDNTKPGVWQQVNKNTDTLNKELAITGEGNAVKIAVIDDNDTSKSDTLAFAGDKGVGVAVKADDGSVTITGTLYSLENDLDENGTYTITLNADGTSTVDSSIALRAGSNITFTEAADGALEIAAVDTYVTSDDSEVTISKDGEGKSTIAITVADTSGNKAIATETGSLWYTVNNETIYNQSELPVYSKAQIDKKFNELNPMSYKGTVSSAAGLTGLTGVKAGDTYMVAEGFTYNGTAAKNGDLFIATGEEDETTGIISNVTWTYVPAGDDAQKDTTYYGAATAGTNTLVIKDSEDTAVASQQITGDSKVVVTSTAVAHNGVSNAGLNITVKHAEVGNVNELDTGTTENNVNSLTAIKTATVDSTGHVTALETYTYNLEGYALQDTSVALDGNVATVTSEMKSTSDSAAGKVEFAIDASADDSLHIATDGTNIQLSLQWGSF